MTRIQKNKSASPSPVQIRAVVKEVRGGRAYTIDEEETTAWRDIPRGVKLAPNDIVLLEKKGSWVLQEAPLPYREIEQVTHPLRKGLVGIPVFKGSREDAFSLEGRTYYQNEEAAIKDVRSWKFRDTEAEAEYLTELIKGSKAIPGVAFSSGAVNALASLGVETGTLAEINEAITRLEGQQKAVQGALEKLEQRPATLQGDIAQLEEQLGGLRTEESRIAASVSTLTQEHDQLHEALEKLRGQKTALSTELRTLDGHLREARQRLQEREQVDQDPRAVLRELPPVIDEKEALSRAYRLLEARLESPLPLVLLHVATKLAPFTVLTGPSGAGKTSLVHLYARALGINVTTVAVQPNWTSVQDLHGYVDPMGRTSYRGTPFSKALETQVNYAAVNDETAPLDLVLLDEINLSFVEYFLADYLSAFETVERAVQVATRDEVEDLSGEAYRWLRGAGGRVQVPRSFLIAGTANEDHTTRAFSDKFRDRSAFLLIPPPDIQRALKEEVALPPQEFYIPRSAWEGWQDEVAPTADQRQVISRLAEKVVDLGLPFSVRVFQRALKQYTDSQRMLEWFGLDGPEQRALDLAVSLSVAPKYGQLLLGRTQEEQRKRLRQVLPEGEIAPLTTRVLNGIWPKSNS